MLDKCINLWHQRLGHVGEQTLRDMAMVSKEMVGGVKFAKITNPFL